MDDTVDFDFKGLTARRKIVVLLALLTGTLHLIRGILIMLSVTTLYSWLYVGNFVGNVFFVTILYFTPPLDDYRKIIRYLFVLFTHTMNSTQINHDTLTQLPIS